MWKVFLADDEKIVREGLKFVVDWKELGYSICGEASNGEDTLKKILTLRPDLVLLDMRMPDLLGTEIIQQSREQHYKGHFIILSGYSDFRYAQTAIRYGVDFYLTKPIDEDELSQALNEVKQSLLSERNNSNTIDQFREKAKYTILHDLLLNIKLSHTIHLEDVHLTAPVYQVVLYENYNHETLRLPYSLADLFTVTNKGAASFEYIRLQQREVILLKGEYALHRFQDFLHHYENNPQKGSPMDSLFITYGHVVSEPEDIHLSYEDALELLNRRFFCEQNQHAIGYDKLPKASYTLDQSSSLSTKQYSDYFINCIQSQNRLKLAERLHLLEKKLFTGKEDIPQIKLLLTDIYLQVKQAILQIYNMTDITFSANASIIHYIESRYYLYEIITFLSEQFEMIMNAVSNHSKDSVFSEIIHYINHNYQENIKLETIASLFGYNTSYLGKIFNKRMGVSFNSYLDHIRIEQSKKLLLQDNFKVYEIAEKVGYRNVDYFHLKFKKLVGESPVNYRKEHNIMITEQSLQAHINFSSPQS